MVDDSVVATLEGHDGRIVGAEQNGIHVEVELSPQELSAFLNDCGQGKTIEVLTPDGRHNALARRWWVWPREGRVRVRVLLEESLAT